MRQGRSLPSLGGHTALHSPSLLTSGPRNRERVRVTPQFVRLRYSSPHSARFLPPGNRSKTEPKHLDGLAIEWSPTFLSPLLETSLRFLKTSTALVIQGQESWGT